MCLFIYTYISVYCININGIVKPLIKRSCIELVPAKNKLSLPS